MVLDTSELSARIEAVRNVTADANRLVTLAVPPDRAVGEALERIEEDRAEAEYIDSGSSSKRQRRALERLQHRLHDYDRTPENGLVLYVGVADGDLIEYAFDDLPAPVEEWRYETANAFDATPLETVARPSETYGLLVIERGGAALGRLDGDRVETVETFDSDVMGKTRAGGQSAQRFERERERQKEEFFRSVANEARRAFLDVESDAATPDDGEADDVAVDTVLLGGTEITVDEFRRGEYLDYRLRDRIVGGAFPVEYATEQGLEELVERARESLPDAEEREAREALDAFFDALESDAADVVYGREATDEALEYGAVETALASEALDPDVIREVRDRAADEGGEFVLVPTAFERGGQFAEAFDGVGGVLRFPVE